MFGSIKKILLALIVGLVSTTAFASEETLEEQALRNAVKRYNSVVKEIGVDNAELRITVVSNIYKRELARLKSEKASNWEKVRRSPQYRFGIHRIKNDLDRYVYVRRNFKEYYKGNPDYVRVRRGVPFRLPNPHLSRLEYLRIYANRYAQSYNMGLNYVNMDRRLPFYDRRMIRRYHPRY